MKFDRILLLFLSLLHTTLSGKVIPKPKFHLDPKTTKRGIKWLSPSRTLLIHLKTPDLPLWNTKEHIGEHIPSSFVLEIALSHDNRTLLVQGQAFLPLPSPNVPPRLFAPQTKLTTEQFHNEPLPDFYNLPSFGIDYTRLVLPRDDWSIGYKKYTPEVTIDLIGAGIAGHNALLPSHAQYIAKIKLIDYNSLHSHTTNPPNHNFTILDAWLQQRDEQYNFPDVEGFKECKLSFGGWSWRCEDIEREPWYRNILRRDFDEWGKIGSLRREVVKRRDAVRSFLAGEWMVGVLLLAVIGTVFALLRNSLYDLGLKVMEYSYSPPSCRNPLVAEAPFF